MGRKKKVKQDILMTGIADKGFAVGRDEEGMVYFVDGAVPGDVVDVLVLRKKRSFKKGIVKTYKQYSPDRIDAPCIHFNMCGGCKWQHLDYNTQLKHKEQQILDSFKRIAHLEAQQTFPILGCASIFQYRNKMEYSFAYRRWVSREELDSDKVIDFAQAVGFHRAGSFDKVVQIEKCLLQDDLSNKIRNSLHDFALSQSWTYCNAREHHGFLRNLRVRNTTTGEWMVIVIFGENKADDIETCLSFLQKTFPEITSLGYVINEKMNDSINDLDVQHFHGQNYITEKLGHLKYNIGPKSFFQTNTKQAELLYDQIVKHADLKGHEIVYDLYTGLGSIALYIAQYCKKVIGIEEIKEAIDDANDNKVLNNIDNAYFEVGDVKNEFNGAFVDKYGAADLIIVDPPRAGLHADVVHMLNQTGVEKIIYVSCNPSTQARDIGMMSDYYDIALMQPVDMFPHTHHVENIAVLKKK